MQSVSAWILYYTLLGCFTTITLNIVLKGLLMFFLRNSQGAIHLGMRLTTTNSLINGLVVCIKADDEHSDSCNSFILITEM